MLASAPSEGQVRMRSAANSSFFVLRSATCAAQSLDDCETAAHRTTDSPAPRHGTRRVYTADQPGFAGVRGSRHAGRWRQGKERAGFTAAHTGYNDHDQRHRANTPDIDVGLPCPGTSAPGTRRRVVWVMCHVLVVLPAQHSPGNPGTRTAAGCPR
jgi:hypothetical protein